MRHKPDLLKRLESEAHVWLVKPVDVKAENLSHCLSLLAPDEREKHARFHSDADRRNYLIAHALQRTALSGYADLHPSEWRFSVGSHGRPEIETPAITAGLRFNLTHTSGLCACLVTLEWDCGVDAEEISRGNDLGKIARRMFAAEERSAMGELIDSSAREQFFRYWTLREAYAKALGVGLGGLPRDFHFEAVNDDRPRVVFDEDGTQADRWQFALLRPTAAHVLAIALHRPGVPDLKIVPRMAELTGIGFLKRVQP